MTESFKRLKYAKSDKWDKVRADFISSDLTITEVAQKHSITNIDYLWKIAKRGHWKEMRDEIRKGALEKYKEKAKGDIARKWESQEKLWKAVEIQAASILKSTQSDDGKTISPLDPKELSALTQSLERALKCQKLLSGESTGDGININAENISLQVLNLIEQKEKEVLEQDEE